MEIPDQDRKNWPFFTSTLCLTVLGLVMLPFGNNAVTLAQGVLSPPSQEPSPPVIPSPVPSLEEVQPPTPTPLEPKPVDLPIEGTVIVKEFQFRV